MTAKSKPSRQPWVDPDDAPEITEQWVSEADLYQGEKLLRRGRPKSQVTKEPVKIRLDADVLAARRGEVELRLQALEVELETARLWAQLNFLFPEGGTAQHSAATIHQESK